MTSILILTEGGAGIGIGHVRRCLTLAAALRNEGAVCRFRLRGRGAAGLVAKHGFEAEEVDEFHIDDSDAVLIDSYRIDEQLFRSGKPVIVIDDVGDRALPVDVILNPGANAESLAYCARPDTVRLMGPAYALLRPEFAEPPQRTIHDAVMRVLITIGGSDHGTLARDLAAWMLDLVPHVTLIVGPFFRNVRDLEALGGLHLVFDPENMRELMLQCDVAVSAGGQTLYELAATGTPALAIATAENQKHNLAGLAAAGTIVTIDGPSQIAFDRIRPAHVRSDMSRRGRALIDGRGAERAAQRIMDVVTRRRNE